MVKFLLLKLYVMTPKNPIPSNGFGVVTCSKFITKIKLEEYVEDKKKMLLIYY